MGSVPVPLDVLPPVGHPAAGDVINAYAMDSKRQLGSCHSATRSVNVPYSRTELEIVEADGIGYTVTLVAVPSNQC